MRITTIATADQRDAVTAAAEAAGIIRDRIETADLVELAAAAAPGAEQYQLLNIWGPGSDKGTEFNDRPLLWCDVDGEGDEPKRLTAADVTKIEALLRQAGEHDPSVFGAGELAAGVWELHVNAVLKASQGEAVERLVNHMKNAGIDECNVDGLVCEIAARPNGDDEQAEDDGELADQINEQGIQAQAQFLIERLGEREATSAVDLANDDS